MNSTDLKNMIREVIREELQSTLSEEEYDQARDAWLDDNPGSSWKEFRRRGGDLSPWYPKSSTGGGGSSWSRGAKKSPTDWNQILGKTTWQAQQQAAAAPTAGAAAAPAADKNALLAQKVKYKDADGKEHEATVKSLLGYAKDHPGRKIAARMYAQFMAKSGQQRKEGTDTTNVTEDDSHDEYDPYTATTPRPPMWTPRDKRAKWMVTPSGEFKQRPTRPSKPSAPTQSTPSPSPATGQQGKSSTLQQVIKYKKNDGSEGEGTIKSLLSYPPDHPGHKAAKAAYAKQEAYEQPTSEKMCEGEGCLDEKSVPQPYDRKKARKMGKGQIDNRKRIGRNMLSNEKTVSKFRKKFGDDWKDHLWAAASSAAFRSSGSNKGDDKKK